MLGAEKLKQSTKQMILRSGGLGAALILSSCGLTQFTNQAKDNRQDQKASVASNVVDGQKDQDGADEPIEMLLTRDEKDLWRAILNKLKRLAVTDNNLEKRQLQMAKQCDDYELLKLQISTKSSSSFYEAFDKIEDQKDDLWVSKDRARYLKHGLAQNIVKLDKFQDYNKGELRCMRSMARFALRKAGPGKTDDQRIQKLQNQIILKAIKARVRFAGPATKGSRSGCDSKYDSLKQLVQAKDLAEILKVEDEIKSKRAKVREFAAEMAKEARKEKLPVPSEKQLTAVENHFCELPVDSSDDLDEEPEDVSLD